jgi:hypothetical protein
VFVPELDLTAEAPVPEPPLDPLFKPPPVPLSNPFNIDEKREGTRGDLARGLLWLLTFVVGGVLVFVGLGRLEGTVITQSIFPSLIALAGTALGFYFGSQSGKNAEPSPVSNGSSAGAAGPDGDGK